MRVGPSDSETSLESSSGVGPPPKLFQASVVLQTLLGVSTSLWAEMETKLADLKELRNAKRKPFDDIGSSTFFSRQLSATAELVLADGDRELCPAEDGVWLFACAVARTSLATLLVSLLPVVSDLDLESELAGCWSLVSTDLTGITRGLRLSPNNTAPRG